MVDDIFDKADVSQLLDQSQIGMSPTKNLNKTTSFVGEMVKQMNLKAEEMRRTSVILSKQIELGQPTENTNFSLVMCQEWEKTGHQSFFDLVELIKCGVPSMLRKVVWSDLMRTNLIELEEKKHMLRNYPQQYQKNLSPFENLMEFSNKYDSVAFKQIDQDIQDFKFTAFYFEEDEDQGTQGETKQYSKTNRINKLKHDK